MTRPRTDRAVGYLILIVASAVAIYPFLSILGLALSSPGQRPSGFSVPTSVNLENFTKAWTEGGFSQAMLSSALVAVAVVILTVVLAIPAAFALRGARGAPFLVASVVLLLGLVMPYEATVIALYTMFKDWGLLNTSWALILPQIGLSLSFAILWLRIAIADFPASLLEAASIDGAGRFRSLVQIVVPLMTPAITTLAMLLFLFTWNEFLLALVLVPDNPDVQTVPLALSFFAGNRRTGDPAVTAAAAVLVCLPILVAYVFLQRRFIAGVLSGAVRE